jgi:hypothetical protein
MNNFDLLENKLNIANNLIEELNVDAYEISLPTTTALITTEESTNEVFSLDTLKSDFVIIRQNILKLINTGQHILDTAAVLDPSDMKAAQLTAISQLQQTLGNNLKLLVDVYKEIVNIEKTRSNIGGKNIPENQSIVNQGTVNNNNIIFSGSTDNLLSFLKENQNT